MILIVYLKKEDLISYKKKGSLTNDVIYITGHGKTNQKISDLEMEDIAEMLVSNYGYTGNQKIVIASCHGKCKNKDGLQIEICNIGKYFTENSSNLATYNRSLLIDGVDKKWRWRLKKYLFVQ